MNTLKFFGIVLLAPMAVGLLAAPAMAGFKFLPPQFDAYQAPTTGQTGAMPAAGGTVDGFADSVPLTVALRQILPRGMMFNVADDVDVGTLVSWQGGRSWQQVLEESLAGAGLRPIYSQNMVMVERRALAGAAAPIKLTPPLTPLIIEAPTKPAANLAPQVADSGIRESRVGEMQVAGEVTSMDAERALTATSDGVLALPQPDGSVIIQGEVTSLDPDGASAAAGNLGSGLASAEGTLQLPSGMGAADSLTALPETDIGLTAPTPTGGPIGGMGVADVTTQAWQAQTGQGLREVLEDWSTRANVELNWLAEYDYPLQASLNLSGSYEDAVRTLLTAFKDASPQPTGRLHKNESLGQMTLVIEARGNLYGE